MFLARCLHAPGANQASKKYPSHQQRFNVRMNSLTHFAIPQPPEDSVPKIFIVRSECIRITTQNNPGPVPLFLVAEAHDSRGPVVEGVGHNSSDILGVVVKQHGNAYCQALISQGGVFGDNQIRMSAEVVTEE